MFVPLRLYVDQLRTARSMDMTRTIVAHLRELMDVVHAVISSSQQVTLWNKVKLVNLRTASMLCHFMMFAEYYHSAHLRNKTYKQLGRSSLS
jgi:hypothetical protein